MEINITQFGITEKCTLEFTKYVHGGTAITLYAEDGTPYAVASVYVEGVTEFLPLNEVVIKNYSENEGIQESLISAGVIKSTGKIISISNYVSCEICEIMLDIFKIN